LNVDAKLSDFPQREGAVRRHRPVLPRQAMPDVDCAFCGSSDTEPIAVYGCHMLTAQYLCRNCKSTFDWIRND
jgi:hypothetical protein